MITFKLKSSEDLKVLIAMKGHSMRSFSKQIGVSVSSLSLLINGGKRTSAKTAKKISEGVDKEIKDIFFISGG